MSKVSSSSSPSSSPLVTVRIRPTGPNCPIGFPTTNHHHNNNNNNNNNDQNTTCTNDDNNNNNNEISFSIIPGGCIWLDGPSGRGKTTIARSIVPELYHQQQNVLHKLHINVQCEWFPTIPQQLLQPQQLLLQPQQLQQQLQLQPSVGILFQQTTLIDELTVGGNLALAIQCNTNNKNHNNNNASTVTTSTSFSATTKTSSSSTTGSRSRSSSSSSNVQQQSQIMKSVMEMVGLNYHNDINKRCYELSGGMARRVSLAIQLIQKKQIIILDEPFTGLDHNTAISIAKELVRLRNAPYYIAIVLITHEPELARIVLNECTTTTTTTTTTTMDGNTTKNANSSIGNVIVSLPEPKASSMNTSLSSSSMHPHPTTTTTITTTTINTTGIYMYDRFRHRLYDYIIYSIPLMIGTFIATGMAISMICADAIQRLQIQEPIQQIIDQEIRPLIIMITGETTINPLYMLGIKMKVNQMLQTTIPNAKMNIYSIGLIQLFVLEIGPLLTGLLLAGRIGGSYSGNIITMITTSQIHLLRTMGISTNIWLFYPTIYAAWMTGPILTFIGTSIALLLTSIVGVRYQLLPSIYDFWKQVQITIFPTLRLQGIIMSQQQQQQVQQEEVVVSSQSPTIPNILELNYYRTTYSPNSWYATIIEIITYPILFAIIKSIVFITIIICTAEICTRYYNHYNYYSHSLLVTSTSSMTRNRQHHTLTHRDVPNVITTSVVMASLGIILADWGFSRLWLQRH